MSRNATTTAVGIIIAQYGQSALTQLCVASLRTAHPETPVFVIDDGSPNGQDRRELQRACWKQVTIVSQHRNSGVTQAWNAGAEICRERMNPEFLVFLNNDVVTTGPWLPRLLAPLGQGTILLTGPAQRREQSLPQLMLSELPTTQFLEGWCLAIRTETFVAQGGFDATMRLYFSDTDLQCRLLAERRDAIQMVDGLPLTHLGHQSTQTHPQRSHLWWRDRERFMAKWFPR